MQCPRCKIGIDDDGDGNCGVCAKYTDVEVIRKLASLVEVLALGKGRPILLLLFQEY